MNFYDTASKQLYDMTAVQKTKDHIGRLIDRLTKMKENAARQAKDLRSEADTLVVEA